jgi:hypothetical protein
MILSQRTLSMLTLLNSGLLVTIVLYLVTSDIPGEESNSVPSVTTIETTTASTEKGSQANLVKEDVVKSSTEIPKETAVEKVADSQEVAQNFAQLLEQTIEPLLRASSDHNEKIDLPTEEQIAAADASKSISSPETQLVLDILKDGYKRYNMPFPTLKVPKEKTIPEPDIKQGEELDPDSQSLEIKAWLIPTVERLRTELQKKGEKELGIIPSEVEIQAAISSGQYQSTEAELVVDMLKNGFARFSLPFPDPNNPGTIEEQPETNQDTEGQAEQTETSSSEKQILKAYFQGQLQRLRLESNSKSIDIESSKPSEEEISLAVQTGSLSSDESQSVIAKIKTCYEKLSLTFYAPPVGD